MKAMNNKKKPKTNNVVQFPKSAIVNPSKTALHSDKVPESIEEIKGAVELVKLQRIGQIMETVLPLLAQGLAAYSINMMQFRNEGTIKSSAIMIESVKAYLYRHFDLDHPLHPLTDTLVGMDNGGVIIKKMSVSETGGANNA